MFRLILVLFLVFGLTYSKKVEAMASLRDRKDVQITTKLSDPCIKNVTFKQYKDVLYILGDLDKPCSSESSRVSVLISLLDVQGRTITQLKAHVSYGSNGREYSARGSFYAQTKYDLQIKSSTIQIQW